MLIASGCILAHSQSPPWPLECCLLPWSSFLCIRIFILLLLRRNQCCSRQTKFTRLFAVYLGHVMGLLLQRDPSSAKPQVKAPILLWTQTQQQFIKEFMVLGLSILMTFERCVFIVLFHSFYFNLFIETIYFLVEIMGLGSYTSYYAKYTIISICTLSYA